MPRYALVAAALAGLVAAAGARQQPVFRTGVDTVSIYASVFDKYGEIITDLGRREFRVFDEGKLHPAHRPCDPRARRTLRMQRLERCEGRAQPGAAAEWSRHRPEAYTPRLSFGERLK